MKLDKNHLNQFENIAPPMVNALTIPVEGVSNVCIYVCQSPFAGVAGPQKRADVLAVAKALSLRPENTQAPASAMALNDAIIAARRTVRTGDLEHALEVLKRLEQAASAWLEIEISVPEGKD